MNIIIIKKYILGPEIPDLKSTIRELMKFQKTIKNSIKNRELTYLTIGNAKDLAAYKDPASEQSVRGVLAWNYLYPENKIELLKKMVEILHKLVDGKNTVLLIEHNLDVIKTADYLIDY